jgi:hypothetical protein
MRKVYSVFLLVAIMFASAGTQLTAQKISKYYTQRSQDGGDLFFIFPNEDFSEKRTKTDFAFDITYVSGRDSAVVNFTFHSKNPAAADSLVILSVNQSIASPTKKLYTDFVKNKWEYRYSANFKNEDLQKVLSSDIAPKFVVVDSGDRYEYRTKKGKWKKYAAALNKIFFIIDENQK